MPFMKNLVLAAAIALPALTAHAMDVKVIGEQTIMSVLRQPNDR